MLMQQVKTPAAACAGGVDGLVLTGRPASEEKLDLEMGCDNIADNRSFILKTVSNNMAQRTETLLRGRTWMFSLILSCKSKEPESHCQRSL